ncbi:unnamed protein product [Meganyctiphanes norvegica]|uniref:BPTI/Kunitz inhibitor domain-containing protein n=1 Tax=Meganyctiphanes norvegica TaxID=48144 RepID=A0AAV2SDE1_MEGNR
MPGICKLLVTTLLLVSLPWLVKARLKHFSKQYWGSNYGLCELDAVTGPCRAAFHKFYYDKTTGTCECFVYGGCLGNDNQFDELSDCMSHCNVDPDMQKTYDCQRKKSAKPSTKRNDIVWTKPSRITRKLYEYLLNY